MAKTLAELMLGEDMEGGEAFGDCHYNNLKNHWRADYAGDPCAALTEQLGMIISDAHDDRLYHITAALGCTEIVQGGIPLSNDLAVIFGDDSDGLIYYDEAALNELMIEARNAAVVEGVTVSLLETDQRFRIRQNGDILLFYHNGTDGYIETNVGGGGLRFENANPEDITFWEGIGAGNPYFYIYGWNTASGAPRYVRMRMSDINDEFVIAAEDHVDVEGITISLPETNQRFRIRQNADYIAMYCTTLDAYLTWSDGAFNLQTEETNAASEVHIHGNGTGGAALQIYDQDDAEHLVLSAYNGRGNIGTLGVAPSYLYLQPVTAQDIRCWPELVAGNPNFVIYGWITAGAALQYARFQMSDVNDEFLIEAENNANHEGITISLLETNQRFRIRQNADYISMYCTTLNAYLTWSDGALNLMTDETNAISDVQIHGNGTEEGFLKLYDEDDDEYLLLTCSGGVGFIRTGGITPSSLQLMHTIAQDIYCWPAIAAGNPDFRIYGWITAGGARRYGQFRMDDVADEFYIEAEANANHEGITISLLEANQEFRLRGVGGAERFHIDQTGILGYMRQGELFQWTYQGDLADDASFNLPAFTDSCWGFIQAGNNEEYAFFTIDNDGDVTLISNSANVVANADIDGNLVLGTAATQEPLTVRNRLGGTKNINLIIWYS